MMSFAWILAFVFLPLFPFSAILVIAVNKSRYAWLRNTVFLLWPQLGILSLTMADVSPPEWVQYWALATSILYAFRTLVVRELNLWLSYIAISAWSTLWVILLGGASGDLVLFALGFSVPIALMASLGEELARRFNAAYAGLHGGIARTQPRLSAMLVFSMLALIATPIFPGFFTMLSSIIAQMQTSPWVALGLLVVWFLWSWSGILLLQGLVLGPAHPASRERPDLNLIVTGSYSVVLVALVGLGLHFVEVF